MSGKRMAGFALIGFVLFIGWQITSVLSADAVGMAVGVLFGILAGIPTMLLFLASSRNRDTAKPKGDVHYHYHAAPAIATNLEPVVSLPGYQAWKVLGEDAILVKRDGSDQDWIMTEEVYNQKLAQHPAKALLEDKRAG